MTTLLSGPQQELSEPAGPAADLDTIDSTGTSSTFDGVPAATVAAPGTSTPSAQPPRTGCPRCGSQEPWGAASWCPECGFYPAFDKLDPGAEPPQTATSAEDEPRSALQEIPSWVWVLAGGCLAIFIISVAAKLAIPEKSPYLVLWTLVQTVVGGAVALVAHIAAYMTAIQKSEKYGPLDMIINPIEIWRPTIAKLPLTRRRVCLVAWGTTALVCASAILGGYDVNALFEEDWVDPRPQKNLLHEIVKEARREREGEESLEDAMNSFVGEAQPPVMEVELIDTDCLIIGYTKPLRGREGFASILLASVPPGGRLSFVGTLMAEELPLDVRELLAERMPALVRARPFVEASAHDAVWLRPVLMCRISHESWTEGNHLKGAVFSKMLQDVKVDGR